MDSLLPVLGLAIFLVAIILSIFWHFRRSESLLEEWARRNGFQIISREYRNFFRGPFFWTTGRHQTVYYVVVEDQQGNKRRGWVRCGGFFLGLFSDHVDVRWEDHPSS